MRDDDDLPALLGLAEPLDEFIEDRLRVKVLFWLVYDQRPIVVAVDREIEQKEDDAACVT